LGTLGGKRSSARAINDLGQIVGSSESGGTRDTRFGPLPLRHAFLWEKDKMVDLNELIPKDSGWEFGEATGINHRGQVVGNGLFQERLRPFLLTPLKQAARTCPGVTAGVLDQNEWRDSPGSGAFWIGCCSIRRSS